MARREASEYAKGTVVQLVAGDAHTVALTGNDRRICLDSSSRLRLCRLENSCWIVIESWDYYVLSRTQVEVVAGHGTELGAG